jgi:beta-aspartyl-dipeptidase (metallo-type)
MITLITGGDVYAPGPIGRQDVLAVGGQVASIGAVDRRAIDNVGIPYDVVDATGCVVTPGLIDPHQHLIGGSGERGYHTQTPEIRIVELVSAGITTVVGCLGVDTTTKTMAALVARAKAIAHYGLTAFVYSGGYNVPPATLTGSLRNDMLFVDVVIGAGEIAISDHRSTAPSVPELARIVRDAHVGGMLSGKAGITHFHVGDGASRLAPLRALLDEHEIEPELMYPTHVERNQRLMAEAVELSRRGVTIDVDVVERDLPKWLRFFIDHGGDPARLTASSDAAITSPQALLDMVRACVHELRMPLERVLPLVTANTARVLKLGSKGRLSSGADADVAVLRRDSLELVALVAGGRVLMDRGDIKVQETWLGESDRRFIVNGEKASEQTPAGA